MNQEFTVTVTDSDGVVIADEQFDTISECEHFCSSHDDINNNIDITHPDGTREGWG